MRKLSLLMTARELLIVLRHGGLPYKVPDRPTSHKLERIPDELVQNILGRRD
jgi:hypothetical protein